MKKYSKKRRKKKNRSKLSLCMIVKNEEAYLPDCLQSVQSLVDEMIIVDTGSSDKTVEIAESFGAKVIHHLWNNDFADARNVSLRQATCNWVLVLDADEIIAEPDVPRIKRLLSRSGVMGYRLEQKTYQRETTLSEWQSVEYPYPEARNCSGYVSSLLVRLFRRDHEVKFEGRVHEIVENSILRKKGTIVETDIPIHHYGKLVDESRIQHKKNLYKKIGEKKLFDEPEDARAHFDLGIQYIELKEYQNAVHVLKRAVKLDPQNPKAIFNLALSLAALDKIPEAIKCYNQVIKYDPGHIGAYNNLATLLEKEGKLKEVETLYRQAIIHNSNHYIVHYNLATFMKNQGRYDDAIEEYQKVLSIEPNMVESHFSLGVVQYRKGAYREAVKNFQQALEIDPLHKEARKNLEAVKHMDRSSNKETSATDETEALSGAISAAYSELGNIKRLLAQGNPGFGKKVVFFNRGIAFNGDTLLDKPLGGMETALIHMAGELSKLGYKVKVFCNCDRPGIYGGVEYLELEKINAFNQYSGADYFISVRYPAPFLAEINAPIKILWTGDAHDQPHIQPLADERVWSRIDRIFTISHWQTSTFINYFHIPEDKFYITKNGIDKARFYPSSQNDRKYHRLVYTSTPFRGLDVLLDIFPQISKRVPDAELYVYSSMEVYQLSREKDDELFGDLYNKAKHSGVHLMGSIPQGRLARDLMVSGLMTYPNHFPETSCIAVLEAMAAGLPVVTTNLGALPETVGRGGALIDGDAYSPEYQQRFVEETIDLLTDKKRWQVLSDLARAKVMNANTWDIIAGEWDKEFLKLAHLRCEHKCLK